MLSELKTQSWESEETKAGQGTRQEIGAQIERILWRLAEGMLESLFSCVLISETPNAGEIKLPKELEEKISGANTGPGKFLFPTAKVENLIIYGELSKMFALVVRKNQS